MTHAITASKHGYPRGDQEIDLLQMGLDDTNPSPRSFSPAKDEYSKILRQKTHPGIHVEMINVDLHHCLSSFYLFKANMLVIASLIGRFLKSGIHFVQIFGVGRAEETAVPAFSVIVEAGTKTD
ncbi:hypothetical protein N7507_011189 [Penicillium longicatenatum]|nr:hypothetical protein N7507_011189 [Penicillium longicatenatum]